MADLSAPRKQRHTARRVWQRLVDERGASVAESTVRAYVGRVRRELEGHTVALGRLGGVPRRVRYDNLMAAVTRVLAGRDRIESDRFTALRSHFGLRRVLLRARHRGRA